MTTVIVFYIALIIAMVTAWIINLMWIINHINDTITGMFIFKLIGLIPPFQAIAVWFG